MVTVSTAIYQEEEGIRTLLGVAGIDVLMAQLESFGLDESQIVDKFIRIPPCHKKTLEICDI